MAFEKNNWKSGDTISSTKLNAMEDGIVEGLEPVTWADVTEKPETFTPATHSHDWEDVTWKPTTFAPATHSHAWEDVTGKPATFAPTIGKTATTAKAGDYVPTYAEITGKPATFAPETHSHAWAELTGKPETFAPETHTHTIANVTGLQAKIDDLEARLSALETPAE